MPELERTLGYGSYAFDRFSTVEMASMFTGIIRVCWFRPLPAPAGSSAIGRETYPRPPG